MESNFDELVLALSTPSTSTDVLHSLNSFLTQQNPESLALLVSKSYQSFLTLEHWSWNLLSEDSLQWINEHTYIDLLHALALLNRSLIFDCDTIDNDLKKCLLLPESIDQMNGIFRHIEQISDGDSPYLMIINEFFDNNSFFLFDHLQYTMLPSVDYIGEYLVRNYIMSKQFKQYLWQLRQPHISQAKISAKMLFYIRTCSFYFYVYLTTRFQNFFYTSDEMVRHLGVDYLRIIHTHAPTIAQWSKEFMACITHLIPLLARCCWWGKEVALASKIFLPSEQIACEYVQDLMDIIAHLSLHDEIKSHRSNDPTALLESSLMFLFQTAETQNVNWLFRSNISYQRILLNVTKIPANDIICLSGYAILSIVLADEHIKELKITGGAALFSFNMIEKAWRHPSKTYKQIPLVQILQGFMSLSKNDSMQQKVVDLNQIPLFLEMCDDYPLVYDILWALSFNRDIQQQLRTNTSFMPKLAHLAKESDNAKMRKIVHGLMWNLESHTNADVIPQKHTEENFDVMISYSHRNKELCKQLYDELVKMGYRVWIDFDQMHGNVMDAMAHAIEQSQTVIMCLSEDYRKSNYCRAEAHYAFQRQRKIVPVLLQKHYKPDGWLLFLIGQLLYVDFTKHEFPQAMTLLLVELRTASRKEQPNTTVLNEVSPVLAVPSPLKIPDNILLWSTEDVQAWLIAHHLQQMARLLVGCDGRSLVYLNRFMKINDTEQILKLLQSDAHRRIDEDVSLIELSCFRSLMHRRRRRPVASAIRTKSHANPTVHSNIDPLLNDLSNFSA